MKKEIVGVGPFQILNNGWCRLAFSIGMILVGISPVMGQETTAEDDKETIIKSKTSLSADQYPDGTIALNGLLRAKIEGSYQVVPGRKIEFFVLDAAGEETAIGDAISDARGVAKIRVNKTALTTGEDGSYSIIARFGGDDRFGDSETDLMLKSAMLMMDLVEEDSTYILKLKATADSPDGPQPIAEAAVQVFVKRMFSSLKVAEGETDEEGMVDVEFPSGLAGDDNGNIEITAIIAETDEYGNLSAKTTKDWGYKVSAAFVDSPRALWSPHPPGWMVITFFILMGAVWIHYIIVIYNMVKIKSEGHTASDKA